MRILLDNCVDWRFASLLAGHQVFHAHDMGWMSFKNGELIAQAEAQGFSALITVDKNLRYQQNLSGRKIAIIILNSHRTTYRHIAPLTEKVIAALQNTRQGSYVVIDP